MLYFEDQENDEFVSVSSSEVTNRVETSINPFVVFTVFHHKTSLSSRFYFLRVLISFSCFLRTEFKCLVT